MSLIIGLFTCAVGRYATVQSRCRSRFRSTTVTLTVKIYACHRADTADDDLGRQLFICSVDTTGKVILVFLKKSKQLIEN